MHGCFDKLLSVETAKTAELILPRNLPQKWHRT